MALGTVRLAESLCRAGDAGPRSDPKSPFDDTFALAGETYSLRMVYVHMIGEYSRHNGHADLLREAIDGTTAR